MAYGAREILKAAQKGDNKLGGLLTGNAYEASLMAYPIFGGGLSLEPNRVAGRGGAGRGGPLRARQAISILTATTTFVRISCALPDLSTKSTKLSTGGN